MLAAIDCNGFELMQVLSFQYNNAPATHISRITMFVSDNLTDEFPPCSALLGSSVVLSPFLVVVVVSLHGSSVHRFLCLTIEIAVLIVLSTDSSENTRAMTRTRRTRKRKRKK